jgi:hypothetical protein
LGNFLLLTVLQCRLASSPEAIYPSLRRRRERLEKRLREEEMLKRGEEARLAPNAGLPIYTLDDLDDAPDSEVEEAEEQVVDQASAARTIKEKSKSSSPPTPPAKVSTFGAPT